MRSEASFRREGNEWLKALPVALGGNVWGWTSTEAESFDVLDAFVDRGGVFVDTADAYSAWVDGHVGGESEAILGRWLARSGHRDDLVVSTKVSSKPDRLGLSRDNVTRALDESLLRLGLDHVDICFAHYDDLETPLEETIDALDSLVRSGKVRRLGASNFTPSRLRTAVELAKSSGAEPYTVLQPEYNLVTRAKYEGPLRSVALDHGFDVFPFYSLASGFLTGKYRRAEAAEGQARGQYVEEHFTPLGWRVLEALDTVAQRRNVPQAAVALAWLRDRPTVTAPLVSARTPKQLEDLLVAADLALDDDDLRVLNRASAPSDASPDRTEDDDAAA